MSTNVYANFISEQQAKLRGAGMLDEQTYADRVKALGNNSEDKENLRKKMCEYFNHHPDHPESTFENLVKKHSSKMKEFHRAHDLSSWEDD